MNRKLYGLLSFVFVAAFLLAACGAPATTEAPPPQEPAATEAQATEPPAATEAPAAKRSATWWHQARTSPHAARGARPASHPPTATTPAAGS